MNELHREMIESLFTGEEYRDPDNCYEDDYETCLECEYRRCCNRIEDNYSNLLNERYKECKKSGLRSLTALGCYGCHFFEDDSCILGNELYFELLREKSQEK